ncbi:MAG: hypothetical protein ACUVV3_07060 [Dehalococcoidia bacterium]
MPKESPGTSRHAVVSPAGSAAAAASTKSAARHIAKDYSYVLGELRRIAIIVLAIVAGLVAAAIALR